MVGISTGGAWAGGYGNYVLIKHDNGFVTRYAHLDSVNVVLNQQVNQAQIIGIEGNTGYSFGTHLHFEMMINGYLVDPLDYIVWSW